MQQSKIDSETNKLIDKVNEKGKGFVLDLSALNVVSDEEIAEIHEILEDGVSAIEGSSSDDNASKWRDTVGILHSKINVVLDKARGTAIEVREGLPPVDEYVLPARMRNHTIYDTESFVDYALKYGDKDTSLVFYNDDGASLIIEEKIERGERERIGLLFKFSLELENWDRIVGKGAEIGHKGLFNALTHLSHTLKSPEILESMRTLKVNIEVKQDSDVQEDENSVGMFVRTKKGEELKKFPKKINIRLPVFEQDALDEEKWIDVELRLDIELPMKSDEQVKFILRCPKWNILVRERVHAEGVVIASALTGYTVVHGTPAYRLQEIGRK